MEKSLLPGEPTCTHLSSLLQTMVQLNTVRSRMGESVGGDHCTLRGELFYSSSEAESLLRNVQADCWVFENENTLWYRFQTLPCEYILIGIFWLLFCFVFFGKGGSASSNKSKSHTTDPSYWLWQIQRTSLISFSCLVGIISSRQEEESTLLPADWEQREILGWGMGHERVCELGDQGCMYNGNQYLRFFFFSVKNVFNCSQNWCDGGKLIQVGGATIWEKEE